MANTNTLTGRTGRFMVDDTTQVARSTAWEVTRSLANVSEFRDSDSAGYTNRSPGGIDGTFTTEGKYDTSNEIFDLFQPEDMVIGTLWLNITTLYWDFPRALNTEFSLAVNVDSQEVIGWNGSFGTDGIFYYPGQSGQPARTPPT